MDRKKEKTSSIIAKECLAIQVRYLNRVVTSIYDQALRPLGITINQLTILVALSQMQEATAKQVGSFLQMDPSTMSRNLERMRKSGWIRSTTGDDARTVRLSVAPSGSRLIEKAFPFWEKAQKRAHQVMGNTRVRALLQLSGNLK
jgi:DNA-binding MarR family transcriptional regulator